MRRCRAFGGDAVPVHLPIDWLVLNGFLKRERGEHGVGGGGEGGGCRQRWPVRRLRMRKQSHLDDLTSQVAHLRRDNAHVAAALSLTTQGLLAVDAENAVLRTQAAELAARLASLNDILCSHRLTAETAMAETNNNKKKIYLPLGAILSFRKNTRHFQSENNKIMRSVSYGKFHIFCSVLEQFHVFSVSLS
uniref:BZIP domain-containing protein n=2 Tax=Oryza TaxID=4527 RepID=A0A0E0PUJ6_ORYRU